MILRTFERWLADLRGSRDTGLPVVAHKATLRASLGLLCVLALLSGACTAETTQTTAAETTVVDDTEPIVETTQEVEETTPEQEMVDWRHGVFVPQAYAGFTAYFAQEKGLFEKHGLRVELVEFQGSSPITQALLAGELDSAENNADPVITALAQGGNLTAIGATIETAAYTVYSRPGIDTLEDLVGSTLGVSAPGSFPDLVVRAMLIEVGIDPDGVTLVNAGDVQSRYQAVVAGSIDATAAPTDLEAQAEQDGVQVLARVHEILPEWPRLLIWATPDALEAEPEAAAGFVAAMVESLQYALDNRDEVIAFTADLLDVEPDNPRLSLEYDTQAPLVARTGEIPVDRVQFVADFLLEAGVIESPVDVEAFIDTSFHERALELLEEE